MTRLIGSPTLLGSLLLACYACESPVEAIQDRDTTPSGIRVSVIVDTTVIDKSDGQIATLVFWITNTLEVPVNLKFGDSCGAHLSVRDYLGKELARDRRDICGEPISFDFAPGDTIKLLVVHFPSPQYVARPLPGGQYRVTAWLNLRDTLPYRVAPQPVRITIVD